jgi:hypothetical protein
MLQINEVDVKRSQDQFLVNAMHDIHDRHISSVKIMNIKNSLSTLQRKTQKH